ncbi:ATP12 family chaperone protein [Thalassococcus sp. S3]|uniref:ATP12 family chaperone protein n=1 Tax=Thalassococcus sp. S3 TaxID=2017482 RepID=UPI0010240786|nr:ATP12 family protein [Thalassococcus sp. S3]QBF30141.1 ATPase [Thalassococcus sp. S3]
MTDWKQKRFWKAASVIADADAFTVELDGRRLRTPAKQHLILPTSAMAETIAAEWAAQEDVVDPLTMPVTRSANAAIDKVTPQRTEVADMLAEYGDADLLCYRADGPEALAQRQADLWDPALDWAADYLGVRLLPRAGLMHEAQAPEALKRLSDRVHALGPFQLAAFHDLVSLSGSLILGFAVARNWKTADTIWQISRLDELWQEEQWGRDDEAHAASELKRDAFLHAKRFYDMC